MSNYPFALDDDTSIFRVDDNITEIAGENFNQVRDAIFKIESELGIRPSGTRGNLKNFLSTSFNDDGYIKASVLNMVGLATLPIVNSHVGVNAGIIESKLDLDYATSYLHTLIQNQGSSIVLIQDQTVDNTTNLNNHIDGGPSSSLRHVASHIDINNSPVDTRDLSYTWSGLLDTDGYERSAATVAEALLQINDELVNHENSELLAHPATAVTIDTSSFKEISREANNVQLAIEDLDNFEENRLGTHRVTMHSNGVPSIAKSQSIKSLQSRTLVFSIDGYGLTVVMPRAVETTVANYPSGTQPIDDVTRGDNVIKFNTPASSSEIYNLDAEFSKVKPGDIIRVSYADGYNLETIHIIESINFVPGTTWNVRIADNNILDTVVPTTARIDTSLIDNETSGVLAAAPANVNIFNGIGSITVADPKSANTVGIGFDPNQLDETHYNLYLQIYPTGNPYEKVITLAPIDVTGNQGATKGTYTLESIVRTVNNAFRSPGFNYRLVAYQKDGNFGIALADSINGIAFSIYYTDSSSAIYTRSVIDGYYDALGLGPNGSNSAGSIFSSTFVDSVSAVNSTKVFYPRSKRTYIAGGIARDFLKSQLEDGYFEAAITDRAQSGGNVEITYTVHGLRLDNVGLMPGKTITVQPTISFTDSAYNDHDYGRFMIKEVSFIDTCPSCEIQTVITVVNGVHGTGNPTDSTSLSGNVRIYFSNDSVGFNFNHISDGSQNLTNYHRLHNILVNEDGLTFAHERARMAIQTTPGQLLSSNWHIYDVSPKLKGFQLSSSQNRSIRLFISGYDTLSGEFDGYIGQPGTGGAVLNRGVTVTGRKNTPVKFYTQSGIDYIELYYEETNTVPTIIETGRYIDINIFPSLDLDRQFANICSAEISGTSISYIKDKRQFGTISEVEFTNSAKDYISSVSKYTNANGIIGGLEFISINNTTNICEFNGGFALVNGKVVPTNETFVKIPEINVVAGPAAQEIAICVNEHGKLETIWLTDTKTQIFHSAPSTTNPLKYVQSCTFNELIVNRKDLCLVAVYNEGSIIDARRFVENQNINNCFVWGNSGTFRTIQAVQLWSQKIGSLLGNDFSNKIVIRGEVEINQNVYLGNYYAFKNDLVIEGEGATVIINSNTGFVIESKVTLNNIKFIYNPTTAPDPNFATVFVTNVDFMLPKAAILISPLEYSASKNIKITNCEFINSSTNVNRHPFILGYYNYNYVNNVVISGNRFNDNGAKTNAAIVLTEANITDIQTSRLDNVFIEKNWCNGTQGIFVTSQRVNQNISISGIFTSNVNIVDNVCGKIGFLTSGEEFTPTTLSNNSEWLNDLTSVITGYSGQTSSSLNIVGNTCDWIYTCQTDGYGHNGNSSGVRHPLCNIGNVNIKDNSIVACRIYCGAATVDSSNTCRVSVSNNNIVYSGVENINPTNSSITFSLEAIGIKTRYSGGSTYYCTINIDNNKIYESTLLQKYYIAISIYGASGNISSNNIKGWTYDSISAALRFGSIINNSLVRNNAIVVHYIYANGPCLIDGNFIDSHLINSSNVNSWTDTIVTATNFGGEPTVGKNINHEKQFIIPLSEVFHSYSTSGLGFGNRIIKPFQSVGESVNFLIDISNNQLNTVVQNTTSVKELFLSWDLSKITSNNAYITYINIDSNVYIEDSTSGNITARFCYSPNDNFDYVDVGTYTLSSTGNSDIIASISDTLASNVYFKGKDLCILRIKLLNTNPSSSTGSFVYNLSYITIRYRY